VDNLCYLYASSHDTTNTTCSTLLSTSRPASQCSDNSSNTASISVPAVVESSTSKDSFWRTKLCGFYKSSTCHHGNSCKFAHGWDQLRRPGRRLAGEMDLGKTAKNLAGFTDRILSDDWNVQPFEKVLAPQPIYDGIKVVAGLPPAGFTGEQGDLVVQNTFLSVVPRRPSRRALSLPAVMKLDT